MEEILVKVNYFIREKLWGQLKGYSDLVRPDNSLTFSVLRSSKKDRMQSSSSGELLEFSKKALSRKLSES